MELLNGIEVLLVHEPEASKSSVSLAIESGNFRDAAYGIPGLGELVKNIILNKETQAYK